MAGRSTRLPADLQGYIVIALAGLETPGPARGCARQYFSATKSRMKRLGAKQLHALGRSKLAACKGLIQVLNCCDGSSSLQAIYALLPYHFRQRNPL